MGRKDKINVDSSKQAQPLAINAFAALDALVDVSKLPAGPAKPETKTEPKPKAEPKFQGRLVLRREKKDRGGKTVVIISGFRELPQYNAAAVADLARKLRGKLGCGGSFDRHEIMLQGDRPADVASHLRELGFRVDGVTS